jgi:hypothetical protein
LSRLFGCDEWRPIVEARRERLIGGEQARAAFVNLMRWRLVQKLGYERTHVLEFENSGNTPIHHMVFTSDHERCERRQPMLSKAPAGANGGTGA